MPVKQFHARKEPHRRADVGLQLCHRIARDRSLPEERELMPRRVVNLLGMFVLMLLVGQTRSASAEGQTPTAPPTQSPLGDAIRNLQQSVRDNANTSASMQFDAKGVEFGPWVRRFSAQVQRNWVVPVEARELQESAVIRFNVRRNGTIDEIQVITPAATALLTVAARNALIQSSPVAPLPARIPSRR